jgi:CO/xanthine dehydrogenase Mo-binding subunit
MQEQVVLGVVCRRVSDDTWTGVCAQLLYVANERVDVGRREPSLRWRVSIQETTGGAALAFGYGATLAAAEVSAEKSLRDAARRLSSIAAAIGERRAAAEAVAS